MRIIFEPTVYESMEDEKGKEFDCYHNSKLIGTIKIYYNYFLENKQEFAITINEKYRRQGYGTTIYKEFQLKARKLGFKKKDFYSCVYIKNYNSIAFHKSLNFDTFKQPDRRCKVYHFRSV